MAQRSDTSLLPDGIALRCVLICALMIAACSSCGSSPVRPTEVAPAQLPTANYRLVVLTDLHGALEPCGCTSVPRGGLDRVARHLREIRSDGVATRVLHAGPLLMRPSTHESHQGPHEDAIPDQWRAETTVDILNEFDVAAANVTELDRSWGPEYYDGIRSRARFPLLDQEPVRFTQGALRIALLSAEESRLEVEEVRAQVATARGDAHLFIVLTNGSRRYARRIAELDGVDIVVAGGLDSAEVQSPSFHEHGYVVHAGREAQAMVAIDLYFEPAQQNDSAQWQEVGTWSREQQIRSLNEQIADLERRRRTGDSTGLTTRIAALESEIRQTAAAPVRGPRAWRARLIEVPYHAPGEPEIRATMAAFDRRLNDRNFETYQDWLPSPVSEGQASYVGSASCSTCHTAAFSWWQGTPHGHAYRTLSDQHKQFHIACARCHVTGYGLPGGSTLVHLDGLENVGCETCHGPGSQHILDPSRTTISRVPTESLCVGCHNEEHSDQFNFETYRAQLIVPGHGQAE